MDHDDKKTMEQELNGRQAECQESNNARRQEQYKTKLNVRQC